MFFAGIIAGVCAAIQVKKIKDLTGPDLTTQYGVKCADLGIPARTPDGRTLYVYGDSWEDQVGGKDWRSPIAFWSNTTHLSDGVTWSGAVGGARAQQLWPYIHDGPDCSTVLPSDVITINKTMYIHAMVNKGFGNVVWTEIWASQDSGATWNHTGVKFPPDLHGGYFQLLTWGLGDDGYVYIYSTGFQRDKGIIMKRVRHDRITTPDAYEPWGYLKGQWAWGNEPTPILDGHIGEMSLRQVEGKWVFTFFNSGMYRIDGMLLDHPTDNLYRAYHKTLIHGGSWGLENDNHVAQLYGGYLIPGSNLTEMHLTVSQWNTATPSNWPYHVMQFRVLGFGQ